MSAGLAEVLGAQREYFLFDSFEGLPSATDLDGEAARQWQAETDSPTYFDNCRASLEDAREAMLMSSATRFHIIKGWFEQTVNEFVPPRPIALLRLDGDWYDSTLCCLRALYPHVAYGGLILLDDYYAWEGCSKAVHDYLSQIKSSARIEQPYPGICAIRKPAERVEPASKPRPARALQVQFRSRNGVAWNETRG